MTLTMTINSFSTQTSLWFAIVFAVTTAFIVSFRKPHPAANTPTPVPSWPLIGSWTFFTKRWDFYRDGIAKSDTDGFTFWAGRYLVVGLHGEAARKMFFDSRELSLPMGYSALLGGTPVENQSQFDSELFNKRLVTLMKGGVLRVGFPQLLEDVKAALKRLEEQPDKIMDPFNTIYRIVFHLTMRTVGCQEIAQDPKAMEKVLSCFQTIEHCGDTALSIIYPTLWTYHKVKRFVAGIKLYTIMNTIISRRKQEERRENDPLQFYLDEGDDTLKVVQFIMSALYAGLANTGFNAAWLILHLSRSEHWRNQVLLEIRSLANKFGPDPSLSLRGKLMHVPFEAWETELPTVDVCLKETIRLIERGTVFRGNDTGQDISVSEKGAVIPPSAYAVYHVGDAHLNPDIYTNPFDWDPARYSSDRAEDLKERYAWVGWGVGRHPCIGMRFAKLEIFLITAMWFACFEGEVVDGKGNKTSQPFRYDFNTNVPKPPREKWLIQYHTRVE